MIKLDNETLKTLKQTKNLLAFSGGGDSVALFFLLLQNDIEFDIAIVDYGVREQSILEVEYAKELAATHNKKCYSTKQCITRMRDEKYRSTQRRGNTRPNDQRGEETHDRCTCYTAFLSCIIRGF